MMGAGPTAWTTQYPILIGLANPATFVWTTNCTQYLNEGAATCNQQPTFLNPWFDISSMATTSRLNTSYTWTTGTGGFLYNSTAVEIINPCLQVAAPL
jgi:hypothetical protein